LPIALIGLWPVPGVAFVCLLVLGVGNSIVDVAGLTLLQRTVADHVLARVLGVLEGLALAGVAVGAAIGPLLTSRFGIRVALVVTGAVLPTAAVAMWGRLRRIDRDVEGPGEAFALLHRLPFFEPLPLPTVEYLASHSIPVQVAAGGVLMRQGDPGDRFYVIAEGKADVSADGRSVAMLGPGDYVGEIALLRDVPRTATVTAAEDLRLFALEGPDFVAAVTGHPVSAETADAAAVSRLQSLGGLGAR
jgi:MFS family permease